MKKLLAILLTLVLLLVSVTGCDDQKKDDKSTSSKQSTASKVEANSGDEGDAESEEPLESEEPEDLPLEDGDLGGDDDGYVDEDDEPQSTLSAIRQRAEDIKLGQDEEFAKSGIYSEGNLVRLANVIRKGEQGKNVTVVFYGGANTVNNGAKTAGYSFANAFRDWWGSKYTGGLKVILSGATTMSSVEACLRVNKDVTDYKPDLVFLDFAVQDAFQGMGKTNSYGFDNLVNTILNSSSSPAVVNLILPGADQNSYSMNPTNCNPIVTTADYQKKICKYYDVPVLDCESAFWDTIYGLIEVTEKTEIPVIFWNDVAGNNICLDDAGHLMVFSIIKKLMDNTSAKLNKIGTKAPVAKNNSYFGEYKYMNGKAISVTDIVEGKASGYKFSLDFKNETAPYEYYYTSDENNQGIHRSKIHTYRHYIATDEKYKDREYMPHYLSLTMPKTDGKSYFMFESTNTFSSNGLINPFNDYGPLTFEFYNENGDLVQAIKKSCGNIADSITCDVYDQVQIPAGVTQMVIKAYSSSGRVNLLGIGSYGGN